MGASDRLFRRFIPKEQVGEAASWEFQSLGGDGSAAPRGTQALLTARERRAYERGIEQGRQEGIIEAQRQQALRSQRLEQLLAEMRARYVELETRGADALLDLALEIARQVVRREVVVARDALLPALHEAVTLVIDQHAHPRVHLNPADLELIRPELDSDAMLKGCRFVPDAAVANGGCRVETAQGDIDATLATRWNRVAQTLGISSELNSD